MRHRSWTTAHYLLFSLLLSGCQSLLLTCPERCSYNNMTCEPTMPQFQEVRSRGDRVCIHPTNKEQEQSIQKAQITAGQKKSRQTLVWWATFVSLPVAALLFFF